MNTLRIFGVHCSSDLNHLRYIHRISKTIATERPPEKGGGILADEMGMGKTLTMISVIVQSLSQASSYVTEMQSSEHHSGKAQIYSHSTLIVVPSACKSSVGDRKMLHNFFTF